MNNFYKVIGYLMVCWMIYFMTTTLVMAVVGGYRTGIYLLSLFGG